MLLPNPTQHYLVSIRIQHKIFFFRSFTISEWFKSTILILNDARVSSFLLFNILIFLSAVSPLVQHDLPQTEELNNTETNQIQTSKEKDIKGNKVIEGTFTSLKITIGGKLLI